MSDANDRATRDSVPFAARHGVVRPLQGRYVAGVCAALGRATRTDPVLWRVVLAVLVCFGGVGALIYLAVWLASPEEGDTASPAEALIGRGGSNTSAVLTVVLGLIGAGLLIFVLSRPQYLVLGGAVALAALLLVNRARTDPAGTAPDPSVAPAPDPSAAAAPPPADPVPDTVPDSMPAGPGPQDAIPPLPSVSPTPPPPEPPLTEPPTEPSPYEPSPYAATAAGYRPPFAPHGPFAGPPPPPVREARPPRERSALPAIVFFSAVIALGLLGMLDLTGAVGVPAAGYLAGALAVIGAGLVVGTWLGRARPLIALGAALALALPATHVAEVWDRPQYFGSEFNWRPATTAELQDEYDLMMGSGELDLTGIDFTGQQVDVLVEVSFGEMKVIVPPDVAVEADVNSRLSSTKVFGQASEGITEDTIRDPGSGDPADGTLRLDLRNRFGSLEVLGR